jgi:hypothetical protein
MTKDAKMKRLNIIFFTLCSLLIAGVLGYKDYLEHDNSYFTVEMNASKSVAAQLFYDVGHGYNEHDSFTLAIEPGAFHKYSFPLPQARIRSIRFDPTNVASIINIKTPGIETVSGKRFITFPFKSFKANSHILKMEGSKDVLTIYTTNNANDPITEIKNSSFDLKKNLIDFLVQRGWIYFGLAFLFFICFTVITKFGIKIVDYFISNIVNYSINNPNKAILLIGIISTIASCYPVVFFGMSFVSPVGVTDLYGGSPWIPGFPVDAITENYRGSDIGAMAWSMAPNSVVQHDALFHYFEFPFWTRFVGGGTPLFAQGQSMIGDLLHWIPVMMDGSAIGWDIKFILSKAIFAVGIGLLVFRLTDKVVAGLLITISSCFLGFFAFRFNHPSFFVLTYSPWIILQWDRLGHVFALPKPRRRSCVSQGILLALITWLQLNAGAPKEGVITACFMHALGVLSFFSQTSPKYGRIRSVLFACGIGFTLVMITAPHWFLFIDALGKSFTNYDNPGASTFEPWMIICFFENFFFQILYNELKAPTVNLFILLGMLSAFFKLQYRQSAIVYGSWILFLIAIATAYGFIPKSILISIPFVNKIQHVGDVFSVPAMLLALIIAGYGIRDYLMNQEKINKNALFFSFVIIIVLLLSFTLQAERWNHINALIIITFLIAFISIALLYQTHPSEIKNKKFTLIILAFCFLIVHVRHGMHLITGIHSIDNYMMNPTKRGDFSAKSNAIEYVKNKIKNKKIPTRVIGEGFTLFPGYNSRLGLEGIVSVEALRNEYFEKLLALVDYPDQSWGWLRLINNEQIKSRSASLDMLGIGYIVSKPGTLMPPEMRLVYSDDLDVWQRDSVWPRAFFVNTLKEEYKPSDILDALADRSHQPFAMIQSKSIPKPIQNNNTPYLVIPAKEYKLTNNSTSFSVEASGPGIIVLGETYYPGDFIALVNGKKVDYIRVNEAFKGLWVNKAGKYKVNFTYRPEKLNQALWISFFGFGLLLLLLIQSSIEIPDKTK